jgi:hypothetical protein
MPRRFLEEGRSLRNFSRPSASVPVSSYVTLPVLGAVRPGRSFSGPAELARELVRSLLPRSGKTGRRRGDGRKLGDARASDDDFRVSPRRASIADPCLLLKASDF